jgi:hypothetical protein
MKLAIPSHLVQKYIKCRPLPPRPFCWCRGVIQSDYFTYMGSYFATTRLSHTLHCAVTAVSTSDHGKGTVRLRTRHGTVTDRTRYGHRQGTVRSRAGHGTVTDRARYSHGQSTVRLRTGHGTVTDRLR